MIDNITVKNTDGFIMPWDRQTIVNQIVKETKLSEIFYNKPAATIEEAQAVAQKTENLILKLNIKQVSGPLIREVVNSVLLEEGKAEWRNIMTRVGASVYDAYEIDSGYGFEANDNANQLNNAETSHKRKADKMSKEQNLLLMPEKLANLHLNGNLHVHDLEYLGTRPFCQDWDARYCFYYGLMPDGVGTQSSIAKPSLKAEVAILHLVKMLGAAQTNFAGGEGLYNFLTFLAPYFEGKTEKEIRQLMQMFVYEMMQMMCARGGQSTSYAEPLVIRCKGIVSIIPIGEVCHTYLDTPGAKEVCDGTEILSLNKVTGDVEWKPLTAVHVHIPASETVCTRLYDGRVITTTADHSLFTLSDNVEFIETSPASVPTKIITACKFIDHHAGEPIKDMSEDIAFLVGVCIGDGSLTDNNGVAKSSMSLCLSDVEVRNKVNIVMQKFNKPLITWHRFNNKNCLEGSFSTTGIPYIQDIGKGAANKHIPDAFLSASDSVLNALLDGLLSTDGNLSRNRYEFCTTSKSLITQVQYIAMRLGLQYCVSERSSESNFKRNYPVSRVQFNAQSSRKISVTNSSRQLDRSFSAGGDYTHHDFSSILKAIEAEYGQGLQKVSCAFSQKERNVKRGHLEMIADRIPVIYNKVKRILPSKIKEITPSEQLKYVYDVSVQDNENFVLANGIVAHNTVFSSVQLTPGVNNLWKDKPIVAFGKVHDGTQAPLRTYGEFEREVRLGFKALMDVMIEGDAIGKPFSFPKPEISMEADFMQEDEEFNRNNPDMLSYHDLYLKAFELAAKFGTPYFDNQLPEYRSAKGGISCYQCCILGSTLIPIMTCDGVKLVTINSMDTNSILYAPSVAEKWTKFESMLCRSSTQILEITDEFCRKVRCTLDHKLPVRSSGVEMKKSACDINIATDCLVQELPTFGQSSLILSRLPQSHHDCNTMLKLSRLFGLYAAEGSTSARNSSKYVTWSFSHTEEDLVNEVVCLIKDLFGVTPITCSTNNGKGLDVRAGSKLMYNWLIDNGIAMHGRDMEVPPFVFLATDDAKWAFLHGYFEGDGCYRKNGKKADKRRIEFNTISKPLAQGVLLLAQSLGLNIHYGEYKDKRPNRKLRYMLTINKEDDVTAFFNQDSRELKRYVKIKSIATLDCTESVYDPVNVPGHDFLLGNGILSGNCAYQFSATPEDDAEFEDKMYFREGAHFSMGSWMVMSLNCPRVAYEAEHNDEKLFKGLRTLMDNAIEIFKVKRKWMDNLIIKGRIPFASQRPRDPNTGEIGSMAVDFDSLVYTIGVIGINEMVQYHTGKQIHESKEAYKLAIRAMFEMKLYAQELSKENGITIALARTPAETTAQRFAVSDLLHEEYKSKAATVIKGDLEAALQQIGKTKDLPVYYTNGTHVAVNANITLPERISYEHTFFPVVDGGNILHIWLGEGSSRPEGLMDFAMQLAKNTQVGYFAFTRDMTVCTNGGYVSNGLHGKCPKCGSDKVQHLSRITGYLQAVEGWNAGKRQELKDRKRVEI